MAFPRADIHELLSLDLLHQIIKGAFKDHIITWVKQYIWSAHLKSWAAKILTDIDRQCMIIFHHCHFQSMFICVRIASMPSFPGLHHFHEGCGFKQWTGNDSKGLMEVCDMLLLMMQCWYKHCQGVLSCDCQSCSSSHGEGSCCTYQLLLPCAT